MRGSRSGVVREPRKKAMFCFRCQDHAEALQTSASAVQCDNVEELARLSKIHLISKAASKSTPFHDEIALDVPAAEARGLNGDGRPALPECPRGVHNVAKISRFAKG